MRVLGQTEPARRGKLRCNTVLGKGSVQRPKQRELRLVTQATCVGEAAHHSYSVEIGDIFWVIERQWRRNTATCHKYDIGTNGSTRRSQAPCSPLWIARQILDLVSLCPIRGRYRVKPQQRVETLAACKIPTVAHAMSACYSKRELKNWKDSLLTFHIFGFQGL